MRRSARRSIRRVAPVVARDHPRGGALVDVEVGRDLLHLGDDLDRRRAGPDDRHPLAGEVDRVVPPGGVEERAREGLDALDLRQARLGQAAGAGDQRACDDVARRRPAAPDLGLVVPRRALELGAEHDLVGHGVLTGDALEVGLDLRLRRVRRAPVAVAGEGVRVQLARDVAAGAGVGVVAPGPADVVRLLDHDEIRLAVLGQLDRGAEAGEAGADDQVVDLLRKAHVARP